MFQTATTNVPSGRRVTSPFFESLAEALIAELVEHGKGIEAGLTDTVGRNQSESAVEGLALGTVLFEDIVKVQKDIMSARPSHSRMVFATAGPTKVVSRAASMPITFHSVTNQGTCGKGDALIC